MTNNQYLFPYLVQSENRFLRVAWFVEHHTLLLNAIGFEQDGPLFTDDE